MLDQRLEAVIDWMRVSGLKFYPDKTEIQLGGSARDLPFVFPSVLNGGTHLLKHTRLVLHMYLDSVWLMNTM